MKKASFLRWLVLSLVGAYSNVFILYTVNLGLLLKDASLPILTSIEAYLVTALYFVIPAIIGGAIIASVRARGLKIGLLHTLPLSLPHLVYAIPYYYIYSLAWLTQESGRALIYALLIGLLECLVFYLEGAVFFFISNAIARGERELDVKNASASDFSNRLTAGVFIAIALKALVMLAFTLVDTIKYLIEYRGTYLVGEIVAITLDFALVIGELILSHFLLMLVMKKTAKSWEKADSEEKTV